MKMQVNDIVNSKNQSKIAYSAKFLFKIIDNVTIEDFFINNDIKLQFHHVISKNAIGVSFSYLLVKISKLENIHNKRQTTYFLSMSSKTLGIDNSCKYIRETDMWHVIFKRDFTHKLFDLEIDIISTVESVSYCNSFATLHEDTQLTDFELKGEDGSVHVHRAVLAASSPVLRRMFPGTWRESKEGKLDLRVSTATLQHFKNYIYLGALPETGLAELLIIAQQYMMPELEHRCIYKLFNNMMAETNEDQEEKPEKIESEEFSSYSLPY